MRILPVMGKEPTGAAGVPPAAARLPRGVDYPLVRSVAQLGAGEDAPRRHKVPSECRIRAACLVEPSSPPSEPCLLRAAPREPTRSRWHISRSPDFPWPQLVGLAGAHMMISGAAPAGGRPGSAAAARRGALGVRRRHPRAERRAEPDAARGGGGRRRQLGASRHRAGVPQGHGARASGRLPGPGDALHARHRPARSRSGPGGCGRGPRGARLSADGERGGRARRAPDGPSGAVEHGRDPPGAAARLARAGPVGRAGAEPPGADRRRRHRPGVRAASDRPRHPQRGACRCCTTGCTCGASCRSRTPTTSRSSPSATVASSTGTRCAASSPGALAAGR